MTIVGLGPEEATINEEEQINEKRENVRAATAAGYNAINALDAKILLASYRFEELKSKKDSDAEIQISLLYPTEATLKEWQEGHTLAFGQNQLRRLGDLPANMLTPMRFVDEAKKILDGLPVKVMVHDKEWAAFFLLSKARTIRVPFWNYIIKVQICRQDLSRSFMLVKE